MRRNRVICLVFTALPFVTFYLTYLELLQSGIRSSLYQSGRGSYPYSFRNRTRNSTESSFPEYSCDPVVNVAYIKTHKTASTTLQTIFNRFGFFNNLSFIFNRKSASNGHFDYLVIDENSPKKLFLPPIGVPEGNYENYTNYNMIAVHVRYYREAMRRFMGNGTRFITIIREPAAQWESAFNHFQFGKVVTKAAGKDKRISLNTTHSMAFDVKINSSEDTIREFLRRPGLYHESLKSEKFGSNTNLLWHYAWNNQLFDLGLETELHENETLVNATIDRLETEFDLVVINEYLDESLVVMKKMLCWTFRDILYISKNQRTNRVNLTDETIRKIREWNRADVLLYDRFNKTLWKRIAEYGPRFDADLREFRRLLNETRVNCTGMTGKAKVITWNKYFKHNEFVPKTNSSLWCQTIAESKTKLFGRVFRRQKPPPKPSPTSSSTGKHIPPPQQNNSSIGSIASPNETVAKVL